MRSKDLLFYFAPTAYQKLAPLLALPILSSFLGPELFGRAAILTTVFMLSQVFLSLGLDSVVFYYHSRGTRSAQVRRIANAAKIALTAPIVFALGASGIITVLDLGFSGISALDLAISLCGGALYASASSVCLSLFRVENRLIYYATVLLLFTTFQIVSKLIMVVWLAWGVRGWVFGDLIASLAFYVFCLPTLYRRARTWAFSRSSSLYVLQKGLPLVPSQFFQWVTQSSDRILVGFFVGGAPVGTYSLGAQFGGAGLSLIAEVCRFFMRTFSRANHLTGEAKSAYLRRAVSLLVLVIASIAAVAGPASQILVRLVFAAEFSTTLFLFPGIVYAIFMAGLTYIFIDFSAVVHGATSRVWLSSLTGAVGMVAGNAFLLPIYGIYVVPWVATGSYLIALLVLFTVTDYSKLELLPFGSVLIGCSLLLTGSGCICFLYAGEEITLAAAIVGVGVLGLTAAILIARITARGLSGSPSHVN